MPRFNLVEEPWIPVREGGTLREVGLKEALLRAHAFERIEDPSPLVEVALLRVLLAVLHRALYGPKSKDELFTLFEAGRFPEDPISAYLNEYVERFWLIHPEAPFWQIADLPDHKLTPWTKLRSEHASGNNPTLFSHTYDDALPPISMAEAARALITHQTFATEGTLSGDRNFFNVKSGKAAPLAKAAVFIAEGNNLFETLTFALGDYRPEGDRPFWEDPPLKASKVVAAKDGKPEARRRLVGRTRIYTWISRGVRLLPEEDGTVRYIAYGPGVHPAGPDVPRDDPFLALVKDPRQGRLGAVRLREDRAFWRDFTTLFPEPEKGTTPGNLQTAYELANELAVDGDQIPLAVVGQVTRQDKVLEVRRERYPLPRQVDLSTVSNYIENAIKHVERLSRCLEKATWNLALELQNQGQDQKLTPMPKEKRKQIQRLQKTFPTMRHYYHRLGAAFPGFLLGLGHDPATAFKTWKEEARKTALAAWNLTRQTLGTEPRALKAVQKGERTLAACLRKEEKHE